MSDGLSCAHLSFDFLYSLDQPTLYLFYSRTFAEMTSLVKVLEIGSQLEQQLVGKSMTHDGLIVHIERQECKMTRISNLVRGKCGRPMMRISLLAGLLPQTKRVPLLPT